MDKETDQQGPKEYRVRDLFDRVLSMHMERLIGSKCGIGELPLTLTTISCLILLAEREQEIRSSPASAPERFNRELLFKELTDMGLEQGEDMDQAVDALIQKGYIDVNVRYRFKAKKPTVSMVELMDRAFPNLPGLNLVAYFIQTIEEVQSDRKDIQLGVSQFDRMLHTQGLSLKEQRQKILEKKKPKPKPVYQSFVASAPPTPAMDGDLFSVIKKGVTISGTQRPAQPEAEEDAAEAEARAGDEPLAPPEPEEQQTLEHPGVEEFSTEEDAPSDGGEGAEESSSEKEPDSAQGQDEPVESEGPPPGMEPEEEQPLSAEDTPEEEEASGDESGQLTDDLIEKEIAEFENRLSMSCPLCDEGKINVQETAKGKPYFLCNNKNCNFISWGQPYHIVCPLCKNPFLIEKADQTGDPILKCPRATCRHWQKMPFDGNGPGQGDTSRTPTLEAQGASSPAPKTRKKVRRRRVVRRKR